MKKKELSNYFAFLPASLSLTR